MCVKFKNWVKADSSGKWCTNAMEYDTESEATEAGRELMSRWMAVTEYKAFAVGVDPNETT